MFDVFIYFTSSTVFTIIGIVFFCIIFYYFMYLLASDVGSDTLNSIKPKKYLYLSICIVCKNTYIITNTFEMQCI